MNQQFDQRQMVDLMRPAFLPHSVHFHLFLSPGRVFLGRCKTRVDILQHVGRIVSRFMALAVQDSCSYPDVVATYFLFT